MNKLVRKKAIALVHEFKLKIRFIDMDEEIRGYADLDNDTVFVNKNVKPERLVLSTVCHEIGHFEAKRNGKFKVYHQTVARTKKEIATFMTTGFRAEQYVDKWGEKLFKKRFPKLKYKKAYRDEASKVWHYYGYLLPVKLAWLRWNDEQN